MTCWFLTMTMFGAASIGLCSTLSTQPACSAHIPKPGFHRMPFSVKTVLYRVLSWSSAVSGSCLSVPLAHQYLPSSQSPTQAAPPSTTAGSALHLHHAIETLLCCSTCLTRTAVWYQQPCTPSGEYCTLHLVSTSPDTAQALEHKVCVQCQRPGVSCSPSLSNLHGWHGTI